MCSPFPIAGPGEAGRGAAIPFCPPPPRKPMPPWAPHCRPRAPRRRLHVPLPLVVQSKERHTCLTVAAELEESSRAARRDALEGSCDQVKVVINYLKTSDASCFLGTLSKQDYHSEATTSSG